MKKIDVIYNSDGYIESVTDNSMHFEQENKSLLINATITTDKKVRAYIKAPNNNTTVTDELIPEGNIYTCTVTDKYMAKGTLYVGYEVYDDTGYAERFEPLKVYIDSFVSLGGGSADNVYVVTIKIGNVETLGNGEAATVENVGTKKDMILNFGLPRGEQGIKGDKGDKGDTGPQGEKGEQGVQGIQGVKGEKGEKGDIGPRGEKGEQGERGVQGIPGKDGYTPRKGVDYFTPEDIESLGINDKASVDYVDATVSATYFDLDKKKVEKVAGMGLSANDFTDEDKTRLDNNTFDFVNNVQGNYHSIEEMLENYNIVWSAEGVGKVLYQIDGVQKYGIMLQSLIRSEGLDVSLLFVSADGEMWKYRTEEDMGIIDDWEKVSVSQTDLDDAIGDVETSLENIIAKYGLGGEGV